MSENLMVDVSWTPSQKYTQLALQLQNLLQGETDVIANMANVTAVLKEAFDWFWIGFYRVEGATLVLGPFQGTLACTRIPKGKGECGTCWEKKHTMLVPDVDAFPGHIACSSQTKSEIVIPVIKDGEVTAVLDIDSDQYDAFSEEDKEGLEDIVQKISPWI